MNRKQALTRRSDDPNNLSRAFSELSDGIVTLFRQHLELFREEAKRDARVFSRQASLIAIGVGLLVLGYIFLWVALMVVAYVYGGAAVAGFGLLTVSVLHFLIGGVFIRGGMNRLEEQRRDALASAKLELEKSAQWVKQISKDSSSQHPTTPS